MYSATANLARALVGKVLPVVHLVLQGGEERFGGGVVPADAGASDAGADAVWRWQNAANSAEVYCVPLSEWKIASGATWPPATAICRASVTSVVRMCVAICQPTTIRVARSITVAR